MEGVFQFANSTVGHYGMANEAWNGIEAANLLDDEEDNEGTVMLSDTDEGK